MPRSQSRWNRWRNHPAVQGAIVALGIDAGYLAWSPFSNDAINVVIAIALVVLLVAVGVVNARDQTK
jgi:hypothetical protein